MRRSPADGRRGARGAPARDAAALTVRERIERLLDAGSWRETGGLAGVGSYGPDGALEGFLPANMVVGQGAVDGRRVVVQGDDFTVRGGAADAAIWQKMVWAERAAHELRLPLVRLVDGTGGGGSVKTLETMGFAYVPPLPGFDLVVDNLAACPSSPPRSARARAWAPRGSCVSHFCVIVRDTAQLFVAGPPVVAWAMGETPDKEAARRRPRADPRGRGGQRGRRRAGRAGPAQALPLLPARERLGGAAGRRRAPTPPTGARTSCWASSRATTARPTRCAAIVELVFDRGSVFELGRRFGRPLITALARLDGRPVGRAGLRPGALRRRADRAARPRSSRASPTSATSSACRSSTSSTSRLRRRDRRRARRDDAPRRPRAVRRPPGRAPWCSILVRKCYGIAGAGHGDGGAAEPALRVAERQLGLAADRGRPGGRLPPRAGGRRGPGAPPARARSRGACAPSRSPFRTAERFSIEHIIDPRDTRRLLCEWAERAHRIVAQDVTAGDPIRRRGLRP